MNPSETIHHELLASLTDEQVLSLMDRFAEAERAATVDVLMCLAEVDRRALAGARSCSDLFDYCVRHLRMSRGSAYRRIHAARAARRHPELYAYIRDGELSLCVVAMVVRELGVDALESMRACRGKSARDAEAWLAARKPPAPASPDRIVIRAPILPTPNSAAAAAPGMAMPASPPPPPAYEYSFAATPELHRAIEKLKDILWNRYPFGALDVFLKIAVNEYVEKHDPAKTLPMPARESPATAARVTRRVPAGVRRAVWARDGGRCAHLDERGVRCQARRGLELDHVIPYSAGGRSDDASNVRLLCREHNQLARRRTLGEGGLFGEAG
ncbi:MAG: HNH endonuclease [Elusimicrobiota bacterium]|nr:MAG: HNH endonuclease [Elusimicrobiota bacterium]